MRRTVEIERRDLAVLDEHVVERDDDLAVPTDNGHPTHAADERTILTGVAQAQSG